MTDGDDPSPPVRVSLRDRLAAQGAKPHRRRSDLSRYMLAHRDELHALVSVERYGWADLVCAILADDESLRDDTGKPITPELARLTWSRLNRRDRPGTAPRQGTRDGSPSLPEAPAGERSTGHAEKRASSPATDAPIRPARPRDRLPASARGGLQAGTMGSLLDDEEVDRRTAKLASRQGGRKIAPPDVL